MAVQMPGVSLHAPVDHGEPDEITLGDELIRDRRVTTAVDRLRVRRHTVDHGHAPVQNHREVPVGVGGIEWRRNRFPVVQQVELRPAGRVLHGRLATGCVVVRAQPQAAVGGLF